VAHAETEADLAARKFANTFRLIGPSHYIPGKQDWGAFQKGDVTCRMPAA
jgi:hypothetical protein